MEGLQLLLWIRAELGKLKFSRSLLWEGHCNS